MRTSKHILSVALLGLGLTTAHAFNGTKTPANAPMGIGVAPEADSGLGVGTEQMAAFQAFKKGAQALEAGDTKAGLEALNYAARNGDVRAAYKLGRIYADGVDGVKQNDLLAFEYFRSLANSHADEATCTAEAQLVSKAFVALGSYYLAGIPSSTVKSDAVRAHEMFNYAAAYFGDSEAQYRLGRMLLEGQGTPKDTKTGVRWLSLAASKGQYQAQAVFGALLFKGQYVQRDGARGLMWLLLARDAATPKETWITDLYTAAKQQATQEEQNVALVHLQHWMDSRSGRRECS